MLFLLLACSPTDPAPDPGSEDTAAIIESTTETGTLPSPTDPESTPETEPVPVCEATPSRISCPHNTINLQTNGLDRTVHGQSPNGTPPQDGWPVVILFQGSFFSAELTWEANENGPFGAYYQTQLVSDLLEAGFAVLTPEALAGGNTFWNTNVPPWSLAWNTAPDHDLMVALFAGIEDGTFGSLDSERLFASGISSGGYMTSRMALSYPGRFKALAIQSGSWATCSGPLCIVPNNLPADHPPTLFLHGEADLIVPIRTMEPYADQLEADGFEVKVVRDPTASHEWFEAGPSEVVDWFSGR